jgi:uncharacterized protein (DUF1800 family)
VSFSLSRYVIGPLLSLQLSFHAAAPFYAPAVIEQGASRPGAAQVTPETPRASAGAQTASQPAQRTRATGARNGTAADKVTELPTALNERQRVIHALNRLTFGPRPGDVDLVLGRGLDDWIEDQLHPESIDDSALEKRLGPYASTRMSPKQLAQTFPSDAAIRQVIAGKRLIPDDPAAKLVYAVNVARIQQQEAAAAKTAGNASTPASPSTTPSQDQAREIAEKLLALAKEQRLAAIEAIPPEQLVNFPNQLRADQRDRLYADASTQEREIIRAFTNPAGVVAYELQQAKVMRAIYSERQLLEVMTDFWFNHFNVYQYKNQCAYYTTAYERDVIRPHALGKFYDLLLATAQSPAMLMYLDNWLSVGPHAQAAGKNGQSGLNENYGRELMELHTLGVEGGYTQADVTELARVLTGWTIAQPDDGGQFQFDPRRHDPGTKMVRSEKIYEAGSDEGLRALDMLAHSPATAHFISQSIATRFVADQPPKPLVDRMAATFLSSDGDIREVMREMLRSPEFWSPKAYDAKLKTPLEFVVSIVRATGADVTTPDGLVQNLATMGMQPYGMAVPTGYSMKADTWDNEGALLERINFSTQFTQGKVPGIKFDPAVLLTVGILRNVDGPRTKTMLAEKHTGLDLALAITEDTILPGELLPKDEAVIRKETQDPEAERSMAASPIDGLRLVAGFILASPEFQHR